MTRDWALAQAERMEADARRLRDLAERLDNPGLLPDEVEREIDVWEQENPDVPTAKSPATTHERNM